MKNPRGLFSLILFSLIIIFIVIFVIGHISVFLNLLKLVFYALTFAYILLPIIEFIEQYMQPSKAILLLILLVFLVFLLFIFLFLPILNREIVSFINKLPAYATKSKQLCEKIQEDMELLEFPSGLKKTILDKLDALQTEIGNSLFSYMQKIINSVSQTIDLAIGIVLGFYFLKDREYFKKIIFDIIPRAIRRNTSKVFKEIDKILRTFIRVQILISLIISILSTIGFMIIGLQYALTLGFVCGLFEIIPYFGPFLGAVPALIIAALSGTNKFIWTIFTVILVQQIEGNIITPQIMGYSIELHPAMVILILWVGKALFGIGGMFFAVPLFLIFRIIVRNVYTSIVSNRL